MAERFFLADPPRDGRGLLEAVTERPELVSGLNTVGGAVCHPGVAKALGLPNRHPMACLH